MKLKSFNIFPVLLVLSGFLWAEDISLDSFLNKNKGQLYYNPIIQQGMIIIENQSILFSLNQAFFLINQNLLLNLEPLFSKKGILFLTETTANKLLSQLKTQSLEHRNVAVILLDPGHGGKDPGGIGTISGSGKTLTLYEKDIVLDLSLELYKLLKLKYPEKKILMTRNTDKYLKLEERVRLANSTEVGDHEAILYISVHTNAALNKKAKGYEVWYLPSNYKRNLIDESELNADMRDIAPILNAMLEEEYTIESVILAQNILKGMEGAVGKYTENRGIKEESWFVVRNAKMPSVLIELGFITNSEEAKLLNQQSYLQKLAKGIYNGVENFIFEFESTKGFTE
ncbi:MAG: N-acetylmuramoyl-L-alanine amidase [Spirochaetales bacterium]|nr:N-acetylmuramoyl-L-alanine amidase [Spirochaetales bacterium]